MEQGAQGVCGNSTLSDFQNLTGQGTTLNNLL